MEQFSRRLAVLPRDEGFSDLLRNPRLRITTRDAKMNKDPFYPDDWIRTLMRVKLLSLPCSRGSKSVKGSRKSDIVDLPSMQSILHTLYTD